MTTEHPKRVFVAFPHAGGMGAGFLKLHPYLPEGTGFEFLDYPGKGGRRDHPLPDTVQGLASYLLAELRPFFQRDRGRVVFFGYSLGALVAYEAACLLAQEGLQAEMLVTVSMVPPQLQSRGRTRYHLLEDGPFLEEVGKATAFSPVFLKEPAFQKTFLPPLRKEVTVAEKYHWNATESLACPILSLYGREDRVAWDKGGSPEGYRDLGLWGELTRGGFYLHFMEGGHFFLLQDPAPGMSVIRRELQKRDSTGP